MAGGNIQFLSPFWMDEPANFRTLADQTKQTQANTSTYFVSQEKQPLEKVQSIGLYTIYMLKN